MAGCEAGAPAATGPAAARSSPEEVTTVGDADFTIAYEALYHGARRDWFLAAHRWALFMAIVFGASAATSFGGEKFCGLLAALAAAADMAFDFVGRGQAHADIRRRYLDLMAAIVAGDVVGDDEPRRRFPADYMKISADEPPLYRWAAEIAHHNACIALGRPERAELEEQGEARKRAQESRRARVLRIIGRGCKHLLAHVWRG